MTSRKWNLLAFAPILVWRDQGTALVDLRLTRALAAECCWCHFRLTHAVTLLVPFDVDSLTFLAGWLWRHFRLIPTYIVWRWWYFSGGSNTKVQEHQGPRTRTFQVMGRSRGLCVCVCGGGGGVGGVGDPNPS